MYLRFRRTVVAGIMVLAATIAAALSPVDPAAASPLRSSHGLAASTLASTTTTAPTDPVSGTGGSPATTSPDGPTTSSTSSTTPTPTTRFRRSAVATTATSLDPGVPVIEIDTVDSRLVLGAQAELAKARQALGAAEALHEHAQSDAAIAARRLQDAIDQFQRLDAAQRVAADAVRTAQINLRAVAIAAYVSGGPGTPLATLLHAETIGDFARREAVFTTVANRRTETLQRYGAARAGAERATLDSVDRVTAATSARADADARVPGAQAAVDRAAKVVTEKQTQLTLITDAASSPGTDIPRLVLDAYQQAAAAVQAQNCRLEWWGLAAVGKVESNHGRLQNAHLTATGDLIPHIVGIPLDGADGTQVVTTGGGTFVAAEGPMQFIPSTWAVAGRDGNADGKVDIDNIYDAALGAATYLCAASADLVSDAGLRVGYLSYNHSDAYASEVLAYARAYEAADLAGRIRAREKIPLYTLAPTTTVDPGSTPGPGGSSTTTTPAR